MAKITQSMKKEWAQTLFVREGLTQKEIASKIGVSAVTINKWVKLGGWAKLKQSLITTRGEQLRRIYDQIDELNSDILTKEEGKRYADSKQADALSKLIVAAKTMETETSVADTIEVSRNVLNYVRAAAPEKAEELGRIFDDYIKDRIKR